MVKGIGVDMTEISRIQHQMEKYGLDNAFLRRAFSEAERQEAEKRQDKAAFYAGRFAAKEAVFKALAPLVERKSFDLRVVETLHREDGSPYVNVTEDLRAIMNEAGVSTLHLSITNEGGLALAYVVAES